METIKMLKNNNKIIFAIIGALFLVLCLIIAIYYNASIQSYGHSDNKVYKNEDLQMVYIDKNTVEIGDNQTVLATFSDEVKNQNNYQLKFHNESETKIVDACKIDNNAVMFQIPFDDNSKTGAYTLDEISYGNNNSIASIVPENKDYGFSFSVIDTKKEEKIATAYSIDDNGNLIKIDDINSAKDLKTKLLSDQDFLSSIKQNSNGTTVALDAGHGGYDPGATGYGLKESDINFEIALSCYHELEKYTNIHPYMVRNSKNEFVGLEDRVTRAANAHAGLFVSFHVNSSTNTGATGFEVYIQNSSKWHYDFHNISNELAKYVQQNLSKFNFAYRGTKEQNHPTEQYPDGGGPADYLSVLRNSRLKHIPASLIEHLFISNPNDAAFLSVIQNQWALGVADANAIAKLLGGSQYGASDIIDGKFTVKTAKSDQKCMDILNSSKQDNAKLVINDVKESNDSQKWIVESKDGQWVSIKNLNSNKYLDVKGGSIFDGAEVIQYEYNGSENQQWKIMRTGSYYKIVSKLNTFYCIDLYGGIMDSGNKFQIYRDNGTINQQFSFIADVPASDDNIEEGYYKLVNFKNNNVTMDVPGSSVSACQQLIVYQDSKYNMNQVFHIEKEGKYHSIKGVLSGLSFDVPGSSCKVGTGIQQWYYSYTSNQKWAINKAAENSYKITSVCSGLVVDCDNQNAPSGTNIVVNKTSSSLSQQWKLVKIDDPFDSLNQIAYDNIDTIKDGIYTINALGNKNLCLDVYGGSLEDNANVSFYNNGNTTNQQWRVSHDSKGYVIFTNVKSRKVLDVYHSSRRPYTNISQYSLEYGNNQKWIVIPRGDGGYNIASGIMNNLYAGISSSNVTCGTNLCTAYRDDSINQGFTFTLVGKDVPASDTDFMSGCYVVSPKLNNSLSMDLYGGSYLQGTNIDLWNKETDNLNQIFRFEKQGDYHKIKSLIADRNFSLTSKTSSGNNKIVTGGADETTELWAVNKQEDGNYTITNSINGDVISLNKLPVTAGDLLYAKTNTESDNQLWNFTRVEDPILCLNTLAEKNRNTITDGNYKISSLAGTNLALDVYGGSMSDGANVQLYSYSGNANQQWQISHDVNGYVMIKNLNSNKYLDVVGSLKKSGTNVNQYYQTNNFNQKWIVINTGNGFKITSALINKLNLSSANLNVGAGTNIEVKYNEDNASQSFVFDKIMPAKDTTIMSAARTNVDQMVRYYKKKHPIGFPEYYAQHDSECKSINDFCLICYQEATSEGVDPAVLFCQAMYETGWLNFGGDVKIEQFNFGGLGATGGGAGGASFSSVRKGLRAQVQHLKAYASTAPWNSYTHKDDRQDLRWHLVTKGCAPLVIDLNGKWAVPGPIYGQSILIIMSELVLA